MDPYTDEDPEYRDTELESRVRKPTVRTVAPPEQRRTGGGRSSFNRNQYQQQSGYQQSNHHYSQNHHHHHQQNRRYQQEQQSQSYTREERPREDYHHRYQTQKPKQSPSPPIPQPSSSSSTTLPSLSSISQLPSDNSSSSFTTLPPIQQIDKDQNQIPPSTIKLPKQNVDFISCTILYEEGKSIEGLKMVLGPTTEPDYNLYCDSGVVLDLIEKKNSTEGISHERFTEARQKSNPYEKVGNSIFMNRAAVKLACLDSLVGLVSVKRYDPVKELVFWFADLCSGPGGFTEYLLWRKHTCWREQVMGWGITLKNEQNFDFNSFHRETMPTRSFKPCYGADGTGNLYNEENIKDFAKIVKDGTKGDGVDLVTADGGFDVRGKEQFQEILLKQLILCQVITMFMTLRKDGDFVLKLFDIFTPFTGGIVWILYRHFEKICIIKPLSSRPANSERYIICQKLRESSPVIIDYLLKVNKKFNEIKSNESTLSPTTTSSPSLNRLLTQDDRQESTTSTASLYLQHSRVSKLPKEDINEIVTISEINKDQGFLKYIKQKNIEIAKNQVEAIKQLLDFVENPEMKLPQEEYKRLCLQEWRLPSEEGVYKSVY